MGMLYTALGLFKDSQPLRADNFDAMRSRKFKSNTVLPMATNAAFVLHHCGGSGADNYVVKMYVNEIDTAIPECGGNPCPLSNITSMFGEYIKACDIKDICSLDTSTAAKCFSSYFIISVLLITITLLQRFRF